MEKIIYDIGSNNGDDIPYYLKKSDKVVALEANPILCKQIENRFLSSIKDNRLIVINCVVTAKNMDQKVPFYIHKKNHVLSQFPEPKQSDLQDFTTTVLPSMPIDRIIQEHGSPYYIKIDVENYDQELLKALFAEKIFPPFISAESHSIDVFAILVAMGNYKSFKLVDGRSVSEVYKKHLIHVNETKEEYSFPEHSSGPFGEDIIGDWMTAGNFFRKLAFEGLGWKDIHATSEAISNSSFGVSTKKVLKVDMADVSAPALRLPLVSVIISNYNYARFIEQAIRSVASQTYKEWECFIVDDCSTDDSIGVIDASIEKLHEYPFRLIKLGRNLGQMATLKAGVEEAKGAFVVFLDADDVLLPEFLKTHVEAHLHESFSAAVTASDTILIDDENRAFHGTYCNLYKNRGTDLGPGLRSSRMSSAVSVSGSEVVVTTPNNPEVIWIEKTKPGWHVVATSALMFRRDVLRFAMPNDLEGFRICADFALYTLAHMLGGTITIASPLSCYRLHGKNGFSKFPGIGGRFPLGPWDEIGGIFSRRLANHIRATRHELPRLAGNDDAVSRMLKSLEQGELKSLKRDERVRGWKKIPRELRRIGQQIRRSINRS